MPVQEAVAWGIGEVEPKECDVSRKLVRVMRKTAQRKPLWRAEMSGMKRRDEPRL
jgi:hypothetical protein